MKIKYHVLCLLGSTLLLGSCGVQKTNPKPNTVEATEQTRSALFHSLGEQGSSWTAVKAKLGGEIQAKGKEFNARIQLQAARGKGIRLSVQYLLFEVARVWFTPEEVVFVDLINGGYAQESYPRFAERLGISIDYSQVEALIMGSVFTPGKGSRLSDLEQLQYQPLPMGKHQLGGKVLGHSYSFVLSPEAILRELSVADNKGRKIFDALYTSEAVVGLPTMTNPAESVYTIYSTSNSTSGESSQRGRLQLSWQSVQHLESDRELSLKPIIKEKYTRIDLGTILKLLSK